MGATLKICRKRTACAVLASGVVISLTALTGGVAPAFAAPGDEPVAPKTTTISAPEPKVAPTQREQPAERPSQAAEVPAPVAAPVPVAPPSVETPPQTRATQSAPSVEAPTQTRASEPAPSATNPPAATTPTAAPVAPREVPSAPSTRATVAPSSQSPSTQSPSTTASAATSAATSAAPTSPGEPTVPSPGLVAPTPGAGETSESSTDATTPSSESATRGTPETSTSAATSASTSAASTSPAAQRVIEKVAPQTLEAPAQDVQLAKSAKIVEETPAAAPKKAIEDISNVIDVKNFDQNGRDQNGRDQNGRDQNGRRADDQVRLAGDHHWDRNVRQWRPDWVEYDEYYRPVLSNPYRNPVRIVYTYQNAPRVVFIPPLARIVLEVAQYAAYSFTAVVTNTINQAVSVAVGSFFGGGYQPAFGQPFPLPPPPLLNYANVPVQVRYSDATYQPFRVQKIVDVGDDSRYGERKVLLDGVTPAWGRWTQTPSGERSFEVHKTQQFPGLDDPREAPLPGDYQLRLAADESSSGMTHRDIYLVAVAGLCGALSLGAVLLSVLVGRRRRAQH